ncbi:hypothetical protein FNH22_03705 [Fulvivirga sp. M361]|uniref:hypothetical protein n=1 Tax=Fulvivirga sp. M361 TaxID=2594266 RepID=UPI00117A03C7|nr:hypothetical protein [Fulvivirga sp. M361]TRX61171.1 hypothetical protein FNH22_03705 [Fulvivirga sp. M361]
MNTTRHLLFILYFFLLISFQALSQSEGTILVIANVKSRVLIDGDEVGAVTPNQPKKFSISSGQHYLQVISVDDKKEKNEVLEIESGKQQVLKYEFEKVTKSSNSASRVLIADLDFNIPGIITATAQEDFEYPTYLYAFEKGDEIVLNIDMTNAKGTNVIEIFTFPDGNAVYSNDSFRDLNDVKVKVKERSIYGFSFASNHTFDRDARFLIERIPESNETKDFNTTVSWQETYRVEVIQKPQKFYINSGSHATFKGGKSRVVIPLRFPENTVKWYYEFSASRDEDQIDNVTNALSLASELSTLVDQSGLLGFGIDQLTQPPGSDYCDVYLLDHENSSPFTSKVEYSYYTEGTRENLTSGVVEIECCINLPTYLGLKNPDNLHGRHVVVEVAAIVKEEGWVMHHND